MPRHSWRFQDRDGTSDIILDILEVHHTSIIVILSNKQRLLETGGMYVRKRVVVSIPATETEIDPANGSEVIVHDHNFFVVRPKLDGVCGKYSTERASGYKCASMNATLATDMIWMPHNDNIRMKWLQCMFCPPGRHIHCLGDLGTKQILGVVSAEIGHDPLPCTQLCTL